MPGKTTAGFSPASSRSTYASRIASPAVQPASPSLTRSSSSRSRCSVIRLGPRRARGSGVSQPGPEVTPGVEQVLVDRIAVGAEFDGQHVYLHVIQRDRNEHLTPTLSSPIAAQCAQLFPPLEPVAGAEASASAVVPRQRFAVARATFPEASKITNL